MKTRSVIFIGKEYTKFLNEIKSKILHAQIKTSHALNKELIKLYWDIGKEISTRQKKCRWGNSIVKALAGDLQKAFPCIRGFSERNVWNMRRFYEEYHNEPILQQLVAELPWGHNLLIMEKMSDADEREYYITASIKLGWSRNVLLNQIKAGAYKLSLKKKHHNFEKALPSYLAEQAEESLKSIYSLDFLGITKPVLERELEKRLVEKIKHFILELGSGFSFIGNQYKIELEGDEYFIDLLFFNRRLKCLVAIELKASEFKPEYAGKMDFYLHLLNDRVKLKGENPPIGIILCAHKKQIVVEYALKSTKNPIGVAEYRLTHKLPPPYKNVLPSEVEFKKQIRAELEQEK
ncbi:MAG: PDDEXK nuclease domain-containing protein [Candidatus Omnitrophota bacterium]